MSFMDSVQRTVSVAKLKAKKHGPDVAFVGSLVVGAAALYFMRKAAKREDAILEEHNARLIEIKKAGEPTILESGEEVNPVLSQEEVDKKVTEVYVDTTVKLAKNYAPVALCGLVSGGLGFYAYRTVKKREALAVGAYAALNEAWKKYRERVAEEIGTEKETNLANGIECVDTVMQDENGETHIIDKQHVPDKTCSPYSRFMGPESSYWKDNPRIMMDDFTVTLTYLNRKLHIDGYLMYNDVLGTFHLPKSEMFRDMGWVDDGSYKVLYDMAGIQEQLEGQCDTPCELLIDFKPEGNVYQLAREKKLKLFSYV